MIQLSVDEAYAFDYLAILEVKRERGLVDKPDIDQCVMELAECCVQKAIPFFHVLASGEYAALREANDKLFDLVLQAQNDDCKASDVDKANYRRFIAKQALQRKFFGGELHERKLDRPAGYCDCQICAP